MREQDWGLDPSASSEEDWGVYPSILDEGVMG
jgi:hypothetical protein